MTGVASGDSAGEVGGITSGAEADADADPRADPAGLTEPDLDLAITGDPTGVLIGDPEALTATAVAVVAATAALTTSALVCSRREVLCLAMRLTAWRARVREVCGSTGVCAIVTSDLC